MSKLYLFLFFLPLVSFAQQEASFPRDTSYTVQSTYQKLIKDYPNIEAVKPALPAGVTHQSKIYRTLGERKLQADIFYPQQKANKKYPGVLLIHGGGWRAGDRSLMLPLAQQLAAQGFVTVAAEYRLSLEAQYPAAVLDLKQAIRWMRAHAVEFQLGGIPLDQDQIAVLGCSAGGQLAALIGTTQGVDKLEGEGQYQQYSSDVQAIIDIDGILAFHHPESEEGNIAAQWLGGTYEEAAANWTEASALTHVDKNTPPVLFIGSAFPRFHAGKNDMIKILEKHGIYYETHVFQEAPHSFWLFHPWFEPTLEYTVAYLRQVFSQQ